jgi:glycosyltransferase involved in cell wall biosynthesis
MIIPAKQSDRQRVLIVAFACHPEMNMETRIGWNRAVASAEEYDTTVVHSAEFSSEELASNAAALGIPAQHLKFVAVKSWMTCLPIPCDAIYWAGYRAWHDSALKVATNIHNDQPFKLVHLVSYCGYREPGQWWKLGIPFIWGPVGGTQNFPTAFLKKIAFGSSIREVIRNYMNDWQLNRSRRVQEAAQNAHTVFAASSEAQRDMLRGTGVNSIRLLETAVSPVHPTPCRQLDTTRPFRVLWSGRLREWKALPLLLEALASLQKELQFELRVMGIGSSERRWRRLAQHLNIGQHVHWIGWPSYNEGLKHYSWADAFAFTSLRDTSGTGLLESLAAGTPIIGLDHQGAHDIMTRQCSIPVPVTDPALAVGGLTNAIVRLAKDPSLWRRLSEGAINRSRHFSWQKLSDEIDLAYQAALNPEQNASGYWPENRHEVAAIEQPAIAPY